MFWKQLAKSQKFPDKMKTKKHFFYHTDFDANAARTNVLTFLDEDSIIVSREVQPTLVG